MPGLVVVGYGGKFEIDALVATRKWILGGKRNGRSRFATRRKLEKLEADWWTLIMVANLRLMI